LLDVQQKQKGQKIGLIIFIWTYTKPFQVANLPHPTPQFNQNCNLLTQPKHFSPLKTQLKPSLIKQKTFNAEITLGLYFLYNLA